MLSKTNLVLRLVYILITKRLCRNYKVEKYPYCGWLGQHGLRYNTNTLPSFQSTCPSLWLSLKASESLTESSKSSAEYLKGSAACLKHSLIVDNNLRSSRLKERISEIMVFKKMLYMHWSYSLGRSVYYISHLYKNT